MKYDHRVKVNGKWFDAGVEVKTTPDNGSSEPPKAVEPPTTPDNTDNGSSEPPKGEDDKPEYTRTQIQQMNSAKLRETATKLGIEYDDETATNNELKGLIFAKLEM